jgi:hypothetical protein
MVYCILLPFSSDSGLCCQFPLFALIVSLHGVDGWRGDRSSLLEGSSGSVITPCGAKIGLVMLGQLTHISLILP